MKKLIFLFALLMIASIGAIADTIVVHDTIFANPHTINPNDIPIGGNWSEWMVWIVTALLALWEIMLRAIPTSKDWTIVGKIVSILNWIAGLFNGGIGNAAKTPSGNKAKFTNTKVTL